MTGEKTDISKAKTDDEERKNQRSTISFPYNNQGDAVELVTAMYNEYGEKCEIDQLAATVDQTATSGAFRLRVSTARIFGLIKTERGGAVQLTNIGKDLMDPSTRRDALVRSFLTVPLYAAIYEQFKGRNLPPAKALERTMQELGVSPKQTNKARQAFDRSAQHAGFFNKGKDRLVMPSTTIRADESGGQAGQSQGSTGAEGGSAGAEETPYKGAGGTGGGGSGFHPFIQGLIGQLPQPGAVWSESERKKWLVTAENIFSMLYKEQESDE